MRRISILLPAAIEDYPKVNIIIILFLLLQIVIIRKCAQSRSQASTLWTCPFISTYFIRILSMLAASDVINRKLPPLRGQKP